VHITVDTESAMGRAWEDPSRGPLSARRHVFCEDDSGAYGIPLIMHELGRYGFRATFFCETLSTPVLGEADTRSVVDALQAGGQDVQLHLHPVYWYYRRFVDQGRLDRDRYREAASDLLCTHSAEQQLSLLEEACELFRSCTGGAPAAFRAGNFAASRTTLRVLRKLGIPIDSSYNPAHSEDPSLADDPPEINLVQHLEGVWEVPVTVARTGIPEGNGYKPFDPVALSAAEMERILEGAHRAGMAHVTLVFHCFSLVKPRDVTYSRFRPNRTVIARLRALLAFLDGNRSRFTVQPLGELATGVELLAQRQTAVIPDLGSWRPALRKTMQAVNRLYWT
jgi:peptidoglycan/xylan/chitin deacetylase (PgdA/CDA1 family)